MLANGLGEERLLVRLLLTADEMMERELVTKLDDVEPESVEERPGLDEIKVADFEDEEEVVAGPLESGFAVDEEACILVEDMELVLAGLGIVGFVVKDIEDTEIAGEVVCTEPGDGEVGGEPIS